MLGEPATGGDSGAEMGLLPDSYRAEPEGDDGTAMIKRPDRHIAHVHLRTTGAFEKGRKP